MTTTNRVLAAISSRKAMIAERLNKGLVTQEQIDNLYKNLDLSLLEFCKFQEYKSLAFANGKLTFDEAQTLYQLLGSTPEHFNAQPIEVKSVLTVIFGELLGIRA